MDVETFFENMPFAKLLGLELTAIDDGHAEGSIEMREELSWNEDKVMAHGGVTFTLADTVGGAALVSKVDQPVPTIDMRIDYLEAGTGDLRWTCTRPTAHRSLMLAASIRLDNRPRRAVIRSGQGRAPIFRQRNACVVTAM
jgi:uncharacterized protein (TIGR00369 family)